MFDPYYCIDNGLDLVMVGLIIAFNNLLIVSRTKKKKKKKKKHEKGKDTLVSVDSVHEQ